MNSVELLHSPSAARDTASGSAFSLALRHFIQTLERYDTPLNLGTLASVVRANPIDRADLQDWVRFKDLGPVDAPIHVCDRFAVRCVSWLPRQRSSVHDHRGSSCCVLVISGVLTNTDFVRTDSGQVRPVRMLRIPTRGVLGRQDTQIHQASNDECSGELVTLHVYSPPLNSKRRIYQA